MTQRARKIEPYHPKRVVGKYSEEMRTRAREHFARGLLPAEVSRMLFREFGISPSSGALYSWREG